MNKSKILIKASPSHTRQLGSWLFIGATIICFFVGVHYFIVIALAVLTVMRLFDEALSILVYEDKFIFRYSNFFGSFIKIDLIYKFDQITSYACDIENERMNEAKETGMDALDMMEKLLLPSAFSPGGSSGGHPKAEFKIDYLDNSGKLVTKEFSFLLENESYALALKNIEDKLAGKKK
jgi:hypothetical protein